MKQYNVKTNTNYTMPVFEGSENQIKFATDSWNYVANTFDKIKSRLHTPAVEGMIDCLKNNDNPQFWIGLKMSKITANELEFLLNNHIDEFMAGITNDDMEKIYRPALNPEKPVKVAQPTLAPITLNLTLPNKIYIVCEGDIKNKIRGLLTNLANSIPYKFKPVSDGFLYEINNTDEGKTGLEELLRAKLSELGQLTVISTPVTVEHDGELMIFNGMIVCLAKTEQAYKILKPFTERVMIIRDVNADVLERINYIEKNYDIVIRDDVKNIFNTYKGRVQDDITKENAS